MMEMAMSLDILLNVIDRIDTNLLRKTGRSSVRAAFTADLFNQQLYLAQHIFRRGQT
jgi:hypothetical protein